MMKVLIFGTGYVGQAFVNQYGQTMSITGTKSSAHPHHHIFNAQTPLSPNVFQGVTHALITIPPINNTDIVFNAYKKELAHIPWIGYLSATSVYGDHGGDAVTEDSICAPTSPRSLARYQAEHAWRDTFPNTAHIFRLSGIYGPNRNAIDRLKSHQITECIFAPHHPFSRIHIDDIIQIIEHFMTHPAPGIYNLADNLPATTSDVILYAAKCLGVVPPPLIPLSEATLSPRMASFYKDRKIVCIDKLSRIIPTPLKYPTYEEGLQACARKY